MSWLPNYALPVSNLGSFLKVWRYFPASRPARSPGDVQGILIDSADSVVRVFGPSPAIASAAPRSGSRHRRRAQRPLATGQSWSGSLAFFTSTGPSQRAKPASQRHCSLQRPFCAAPLLAPAYRSFFSTSTSILGAGKHWLITPRLRWPLHWHRLREQCATCPHAAGAGVNHHAPLHRRRAAGFAREAHEVHREER